MDGGAWWAAVHGVAKSRTRLSDFTFSFSLSCMGEGNGNPLQCSCLENPRDGGAWWAAVYGVAQGQTRLKRLSSSSSSMCAKWLQPCLTETLWVVAHQAPQSMGFTRQDYWSGWPCPAPGGLPEPGIKPASLTCPALPGGSFTANATWEAQKVCIVA